MKLETAINAKNLIEDLQQTKSNRDAIFDKMRSVMNKYGIKDDKEFTAISTCISHTFDRLIQKIENQIYNLKDETV